MFSPPMPGVKLDMTESDNGGGDASVSGLRGLPKASPLPLRGDRKRYSLTRATDDERRRTLVTLPLCGALSLVATAMPWHQVPCHAGHRHLRKSRNSTASQPILSFLSAPRPRWSSRLKAFSPVRKRPSSWSRMRSFSEMHTSQTILVTEGDVGSRLSVSRSVSI